MKFLIAVLLFTVTMNSSFTGYSNSYFRDSLIHFAQTLKGIPYDYGGTSRKGFDCSGFVYYVFKHFNLSVPRSSSSYSKFGKKLELESCKPGDIMVFTGTNSNIRKPGHLGIVIKNGNDGLYFIHSSSSKKNYGVTVTCFNNSSYVKRFLSVINVLDD